MTPDHDKTRLRRYVLGELRDEESSAIEQQYFVDPDALDRVSAAEDELIEDYLEQRLGPGERARFEAYYLSTPGHRTRVAMARALMTTAAGSGFSALPRESGGPESGGRESAGRESDERELAGSESTGRDPAAEIAGSEPLERSRPLGSPRVERGRASPGQTARFGVRRWSTLQQLALAASIALVLGAGAVWMLRSNPTASPSGDVATGKTPGPGAQSPSSPGPSATTGYRDRVAGGSASQPPAGSASAPPRAPGPGSPSGSKSPGAAPPAPESPEIASSRTPSSGIPGTAPSTPARVPAVVALSLSPINVRSAGADPSVMIPAGTDALLLRLEGDADGAPLRRGRAVVRTVTGEELWRGPAQSPRDARPGLLALVQIPVARLRADDLIVELRGTDADGRETERARYFFRVKLADRR